jgi:nucleotide-binding universal stress UspA family protein
LLVQGPAADVIVLEADRLRADIIVLGSHGHGAMRHLLLGSVSDAVLRKTTRPVLIVPGGKR